MDQSEKKALNFDSASKAMPNGEQVSRRTFLKSSGLAAVGAAVIPAAGVGMMASAEPAYALDFDVLSESVGKTLLKMARDIYPHDKVPDKLYAASITPYDKKAASDPALKELLTTGAQKLNEASIKSHGKPYADVPGEGERVVLLYAIQQTAFFQKVRGDMIFSFYNNHDVWPFFGYEGSSWEKGGYIDRGVNDISWL